VAVGLLLAAAVKVTLVPALTVCDAGLVVTDGAKSTVNVAVVLVAGPRLLVKTAWYWYPFIAAVALVIVSVPVALPL
jgi:hypothetical protein